MQFRETMCHHFRNDVEDPCFNPLSESHSCLKSHNRTRVDPHLLSQVYFRPCYPCLPPLPPQPLLCISSLSQSQLTAEVMCLLTSGRHPGFLPSCRPIVDLFGARPCAQILQRSGSQSTFQAAASSVSQASPFRPTFKFNEPKWEPASALWMKQWQRHHWNEGLSDGVTKNELTSVHSEGLTLLANIVTFTYEPFLSLSYFLIESH